MSTLLVAEKLNKAYGRQVVLKDVTASINEKNRIGLIGRNGSGKTTLLNMLTGIKEADTGKVTLMEGTRFGVLDQHERLDADQSWTTALAYLSSASGRADWECRKLASQFGVYAAHLDTNPMLLSGGFQMRLKLVRMLLEEPNLLLLDEPVNYLDLPTLIHLERFLAHWRGAYIITSHDRQLLRNLCDTTWDIADGVLTQFKGGVDAYFKWQIEQDEYLRRTNKRLRSKITHAQKFVDRFRYKASKATQAQDRLKYINRLRGQLADMPKGARPAGFYLDCPPFVKGTAIECTDLAIGYANQDGAAATVQVADGIDMYIERGAKVGIVGENGQGKSTLLKTLAGILEPLAGRAKWFSRADIGYFTQDAADALDPKRTVLDTLTAHAPSDTSAEKILATAGAFLFSDDALEKPCSVLSGGERSRLRLACLTLKRHNVLLLDEPTNHLDVETVEVLARALQEYEGTVVVVSHARTFMNAVAEQILVVSAGGIKRYMGSYEQYIEELTADANQDMGQDNADVSTKNEEKRVRRARREQQRQRQREQDRISKRIEVLEKEKGEILRFFLENPTDYDTTKQRRLSELELELSGCEDEWLRVEGSAD